MVPTEFQPLAAWKISSGAQSGHQSLLKNVAFSFLRAPSEEFGESDYGIRGG
jgi:hypothetical protein